MKPHLLLVLTVLFVVSCKQDISEKQETVFAEFKWEYTDPESQGFSSQGIERLINQLSEKGTKKLLIIRNDKIVREWTKEGINDSALLQNEEPFTNIFAGGLSLMAAIDDGYLFPDEPVCRYIPSWRKDRLKHQVSIRHLMTHTSGLENANFQVIDEKCIEMARDDVQFNFTIGTQYQRIGTVYRYSVPGLALLSYVITQNLQDPPYKNINDYVKKRIMDPLGIEDNEYIIGQNKSFLLEGLEITPDWAGNKFSASAMGKIGRLMLNKGLWQGKQLIDSSVVEEVVKHYRLGIPVRRIFMAQSSLNEEDNTMVLTPSLGWYNNYNGVLRFLPRDAFVTGFPDGNLLLVIPSLNMIVVHLGEPLRVDGDDEIFWLGAEEYLFNPLMEAFEEAPYPQSDLITSVEFAPKESVIRLARGSDTWPVTWADDDNLYTAYGDGNGFEPFTDYKLSMGIGRVKGTPPDIEGINIPSKTGEFIGDGAFGPKPCGMLMVDKVLYMFVRNAGNSQLGWSSDYGKTWKWADWYFDFAYPTFVNYGKNYEGALDEYVYIYSMDDEHVISPYMNSNHMALARVHKTKIRDWEKYEYFTGFSADNKPLWTEDIRKRNPVFTNPGRCHRAGISYNKGLGRYLWCHLLATPKSNLDTRFEAGLGIFESPTPWGPWKTVYYNLDWDIGPGETASIPPKWMSEDGKSCFLLFSGDDNFSVREITFSTD